MMLDTKAGTTSQQALGSRKAAGIEVNTLKMALLQ